MIASNDGVTVLYETMRVNVLEKLHTFIFIGATMGTCPRALSVVEEAEEAISKN